MLPIPSRSSLYPTRNRSVPGANRNLLWSETACISTLNRIVIGLNSPSSPPPNGSVFFQTSLISSPNRRGKGSLHDRTLLQPHRSFTPNRSVSESTCLRISPRPDAVPAKNDGFISPTPASTPRPSNHESHLDRSHPQTIFARTLYRPGANQLSIPTLNRREQGSAAQGNLPRPDAVPAKNEGVPSSNLEDIRPRTAPLLASTTNGFSSDQLAITPQMERETAQTANDFCPDRPEIIPPIGSSSAQTDPQSHPPTGEGRTQYANDFRPNPTLSQPRMMASSRQTQLKPRGI